MATPINTDKFLSAKIETGKHGATTISYLPTYKNGIDFPCLAHLDFWPLFKKGTFKDITNVIRTELLNMDALIGVNKKMLVEIFPGFVTNQYSCDFLKYNKHYMAGISSAKGVQIYLMSNTSFSSQKEDFRFAFLHEATHDMLYHAKTSNNNFVDPVFDDGNSRAEKREFRHYCEYMANEGASLFMGKDIPIAYLKKPKDKNADTFAYDKTDSHPPYKNMIAAVKKGLFREDLIKNLEAAKDKNYSPWVDFIKNRDKELAFKAGRS